MKKMFRTAAAVIVLSLTAALSGCYSSSYDAVGFVHSNTPHEADMSFYKFDGRIVYRLTSESGSAAKLSYTGKLESGSLEVSLDTDGELKHLCSLKAGEQLDSSVTLPEDTGIYVIVETNGGCENGSLTFET